MDVPQDGERGIAPQVITNVDKWWIPGVIALSRFSNTGKIFVQRVAQQEYVTSSECSHLYTQQIFNFRKVEATNFLQPEHATRR